MLRFVLRKMLNKKWMVLSLLIGNILLVGITCANPMYSRAVMQRMLMKNMEAVLIEKNEFPARVTVNAGGSPQFNENHVEVRPLALAIPQTYGVEALESIETSYTAGLKANHTVDRSGGSFLSLSLCTMSDFEKHISIQAGRMYSDEMTEDNVVEVVVSLASMVEKDMVLEETFYLDYLSQILEREVYVRVVGVFAAAEEDDIYWVSSPQEYKDRVFMSEKLFDSLIRQSGQKKVGVTTQWDILLDYTQIQSGQTAALLERMEEYSEEIGTPAGRHYVDNFKKTLETHVRQAQQVSVTLWILQVPVFVLLAAFIFMVSRQMLDMEQNEIAVIKSRGANRRQILKIYWIQSLLMAMIGFGAGVPLGVYLCRVLGSANEFMEFVQRKSLTVEITRETLLYALGAALFAVGAMVLPVIRVSRLSIVDSKRARQRKSTSPLWQKMFLDVICLAVALYGLYSYNAQKEFLADQVAAGASLDPLLYLSSSLFILGAGLLALRILPALIWVMFKAFERWWSPALYASFLQVLRNRASQSFIMIFLILTIALGIFSSQTARTINTNEENNIRYLTGADLVLKEVWEDQGYGTTPVYAETDFNLYREMPGVAAAAKVFRSDKVEFSTSTGRLKSVTMLGINTRDFGKTAWFDESLMNRHWYEYLNAMSQNSRAVLVSRNMQTKYGYDIGDAIVFTVGTRPSLRGVIYGFVDYWPGFANEAYVVGLGGKLERQENVLIVANLAQVQSEWGVLPYEVWLKTEGSSQFIYDYVQETGKRFEKFEDTDAQIVDNKNDPIFQGTNGSLTVGFIVTLLLCTVGFLIFWVLSIKSRALQFGIFRAMGMSMREVMTLLFNEQIFISGTSILFGGVIGILAGKLYMPLIQIAYASAESVLPLQAQVHVQDVLGLYGIVGVVMLVCLLVLSILIRRMKIAQALKLGED